MDTKFIQDTLNNQKRAKDLTPQNPNNFSETCGRVMLLATIAGGIAFGATTLAGSYFKLKDIDKAMSEEPNHFNRGRR